MERMVRRKRKVSNIQIINSQNKYIKKYKIHNKVFNNK